MFDRSKWKRVRFGDLVENLNETERDLAGAGIERFIAMEHLEPGSLQVREWGSVPQPINVTRVKSVEEIAGSMMGELFWENIMNITYRIFAGALTLSLAGAVLAAGDLPPLQTSGGVSYMTGGVGLDESAAIKAAEKDFNLSLLFAQSKRGEYLSGVKVSIADKAGKSVLKVVSDGPMLLVRLPAGAYKVSADHNGKILVKTVRVEAKGLARAGFVWQPTAKSTIE